MRRDNRAVSAGIVIGMIPFLFLGSMKCSAPRPKTTGFYFPSADSRARSQALLLAIDDDLLPVKSNLCYYLSKPQVRKEPVLTPSVDNPKAPDHIAAFFYGTVLKEGPT